MGRLMDWHCIKGILKVLTQGQVKFPCLCHLKILSITCGHAFLCSHFIHTLCSLHTSLIPVSIFAADAMLQLQSVSQGDIEKAYN